MFDSTRWYIRWGNIGFQLIVFHLLWFFLTLAGLFVLGFFPATAALFAVMREMIMEDEDEPNYKLFLKKFKSEFVMANVMGYVLVAAGIILYLDFRVLQLLENNFLQVTLASITFVVGVIYVLVLLYIFPIFSHFRLSFWMYIKYSVVLAVARPFQTIFIGAGLAVFIFLYINLPVLMMLFGLSPAAYMVTKVASRSFPKKHE
ncbi:YesL family protein [Alteribacillus sp. HJP-4]|uniref:YesL family protein n=1 Tax=Alteribacillus sp. HJP-4 TaxID=2775394 RepID=UPI0035CD0EC0